MNKIKPILNINPIEPKQDEYLKDGLIYCSKCNTQRSMYVKHPSDRTSEVMIRCLCDCQSIERDENERKEKELARLQEVEQLKSASLLGDRYQNIYFSNTQIGHNKSFDNAFNRCRRYCDVSNETLKEGMGIYLYGDTGTGKTHLTACIVNELINKQYQVLFTNFFEISKMIRSTFGKIGISENDYIDRLASIDFLVIDDLGTERVQNGESDLWLQEKIFDVLNKRYNNKKPTIFSSNHSISELITERGFMKKTVDRIAEMSTAIIKIEGESYRLKNRIKKDIPF
jgi:DNA replication protein DnaC